MTLNRFKLRKQIDDELIIEKIMRRVTKFRIGFDRMSRNKLNHIVSATHFKKDEWIEGQEKHIDFVRWDNVELNKSLLRIVRSIV